MTINTKTFWGARQAVAMKRNGWELIEIRDFWNVRFRKRVYCKGAKR